MWFGLDAKAERTSTRMREAGKVKRIRNDDRALLAPSNVRGKPTGPAVGSTARELPESEWPHAEADTRRRIWQGAQDL